MNLKPGQFIKGQEPICCYNTGVAAVIARSHLAKKHLSREYVVGKEVEITMNLRENIRLAEEGKAPKVMFYSSKACAIKAFDKLNNTMIKYNNEERMRIKELNSKARGGDVASVLEMSNY